VQNIDLLQDLDAKFVDQLILAFKNVIFAAPKQLFRPHLDASLRGQRARELRM
jgi:hypothetical protein